MALRWLLLVLSLTTLVGLYANAHWMLRELRVDGSGPNQRAVGVDDRAEGGTSEALLIRTESGWRLQCDLRPQYTWPYCDLQIQFSGEGLDMSSFDTLRLWIRSSGPGQRHPVRVFLRQRDPAHEGSGEVADMKPHELVLDPQAEARPVDLPLKQFQVASWWLQPRALPVGLSGPQLNRVAVLSFTTPGDVVPGRYVIEVDAAVLRGQWISPASFRLGLLAMWMLCLLGYGAWEWQHTRRQLQHSIRGRLKLQRAHAHLKAYSQDLEDRAHRDALTGVSNRNGLLHDLELLANSHEEMLFPLSVVFADMDLFKQVNDQHGHEVGDAVLRQFASTLTGNLQREDLVARWGGEEFIVVMPQTRAEEAAAVAERLRERLHATAWPCGLQISASFGVAQCDRQGDLDDALRRADEAMYRAKAEGRDRVVLAGNAPSSGKAPSPA